MADRPRRLIQLAAAERDDEVLLGKDSEWTVLLEANSGVGVTPRIVSSTSRLGRHVALYRSVNADMWFVSAEGGSETRRFDPLQWPNEQWGEPLSQEHGLTFGEPDVVDPYEQAVVLLERTTGIELSRAWVYDVPRWAHLMTARQR